VICTLGKSEDNNKHNNKKYEKPFHYSPPDAAPNWVGKRIGNLGQLLSTPHEANIG
jgi:hypothetical protein